MSDGLIQDELLNSVCNSNNSNKQIYNISISDDEMSDGLNIQELLNSVCNSSNNDNEETINDIFGDLYNVIKEYDDYEDENLSDNDNNDEDMNDLIENDNVQQYDVRTTLLYCFKCKFYFRLNYIYIIMKKILLLLKIINILLFCCRHVSMHKMSRIQIYRIFYVHVQQ